LKAAARPLAMLVGLHALLPLWFSVVQPRHLGRSTALADGADPTRCDP
jgi:hypothetical protein